MLRRPPIATVSASVTPSSTSEIIVPMALVATQGRQTARKS
jgi:hypothetical protein